MSCHCCCRRRGLSAAGVECGRRVSGGRQVAQGHPPVPVFDVRTQLQAETRAQLPSQARVRQGDTLPEMQQVVQTQMQPVCAHEARVWEGAALQDVQ